MSVRRVDVATLQHMTLQTHGPLHQLRKLFEVRDIGVFHSTMLVGCHLPKEVHGCDEIILRLDGESTIDVEEVLYQTGNDQATVIPAGTWHQSSSQESSKEVVQIVLLAYQQEQGSILNLVLNSWSATTKNSQKENER